ncbi:hypothetical protein F2Q68_00031520 [Brassica cretica]|uniref:Uncharacterized protein n=2 Tax=Brassica cretica TaxID=69181 RepID=A0A8S9G949_BRACR|nr:hypothetical protein F2Q68_00031520 [Brassica cretica]KAF3533597.1 hypothetical protein DY000_02041191 [Brassica cretica]
MINPNVIRENEFLRLLNRKVPTVTPIEMKQEQVRSNPKGGSCEDGMKTTQSFQLGHPPNWSRVRSSSADGRAGRVFNPDRPSAVLVAWSIQHGHPPSWTGSARRMAELVAWPSWTVCFVHPSIKRA